MEGRKKRKGMMEQRRNKSDREQENKSKTVERIQVSEGLISLMKS